MSWFSQIELESVKRKTPSFQAIVMGRASFFFGGGGRQIGNVLHENARILCKMCRLPETGAGREEGVTRRGHPGNMPHRSERRNQKSLTVGTRQLALHWHVCDTQTERGNSETVAEGRRGVGAWRLWRLFKYFSSWNGAFYAPIKIIKWRNW